MKTIEVLLIDTNKININDILFSSFISESERKEFEKYQHIETRNEKIVSRYLKNKYIGEYYIGESGKPLAKDKHFNISHSHGVVVMVIDEVNVGVDVEIIKDYSEELKNYISSFEEKLYIKDRISFFEVWTNKEALLKAVGTGLRNKINEIPSLPINGKRTYQGVEYLNKTLVYNELIITVSRESIEEFEIKLNEDI